MNEGSNKVKVSDYVASFLADKGVRHAFGLTGGAVVHLFDSLHACDGIKPIFTHHEQSAALAAASYARYHGLGACFVTTGPGGTNAVTGVLGAWQDSIPCIFISGNVRSNHMSHNRPYRQIGTQEFDILSVVKDITKYAAVVNKPEDIQDVMETAWKTAIGGRPGPVWVDIPMDVQWSMVETIESEAPCSEPLQSLPQPKPEDVRQVCELLQKSQRPLLLVGYGVRLSHSEAIVHELAETLGIPVIGSWTGNDIFASDHELYTGIPGVSGQRGGNLAMQNSDLLIALGSHLCFPITGGNFAAFAREAEVVVVDVDPVELDPYTVRIDHPVLSDVGAFCSDVLESLDPSTLPDITPWRNKCRVYSDLNNVSQDRYERTDFVDPYVFMAEISEKLTDEPLVVDGGGTSLYASFQALKTHENQRLLCASAISAMGTGLPDAIGAAFASGKTTICTIGDGSMQLNIQELQTIKTYNLPIKIVILNNSGYLAIRHTQDGFLGGKYVGSDEEGGVGIPSYEKISGAYGIRYNAVHCNAEIEVALDDLLKDDTPAVCELFIDPKETSLFSQGFKSNPDGTFAARPLEDMEPLLPRDQFHELMEIDEWNG